MCLRPGSKMVVASSSGVISEPFHEDETSATRLHQEKAELETCADQWKHGRLLTVDGSSKCVSAVAMAHGMVFSGSSDGSISVVSGTSGAPITKLFGHVGPVLAITASGAVVYSGGEDGYIRGCRIAGWAPAAPVTSHGGPIWSLVVNPTGTRLYSCAGDGSIVVWSAATDGEPLRLQHVLAGHSKPVYALALGGPCLYSGSSDHQIRVWYVGQSHQVDEHQMPHQQQQQQEQVQQQQQQKQAQPYEVPLLQRQRSDAELERSTYASPQSSLSSDSSLQSLPMSPRAPNRMAPPSPPSSGGMGSFLDSQGQQRSPTESWSMYMYVNDTKRNSPPGSSKAHSVLSNSSNSPNLAMYPDSVKVAGLPVPILYPLFSSLISGASATDSTQRHMGVGGGNGHLDQGTQPLKKRSDRPIHVATYRGHLDEVVSLAWGYGVLYSGSADGTVKAWSAWDPSAPASADATSDACLTTLRSGGSDVRGLAADASFQLFVGGRDIEVWRWSAHCRRFVRVHTMATSKGPIICIAANQGTCADPKEAAARRACPTLVAGGLDSGLSMCWQLSDLPQSLAPPLPNPQQLQQSHHHHHHRRESLSPRREVLAGPRSAAAAAAAAAAAGSRTGLLSQQQQHLQAQYIGAHLHPRQPQAQPQGQTPGADGGALLQSLSPQRQLHQHQHQHQHQLQQSVHPQPPAHLQQGKLHHVQPQQHQQVGDGTRSSLLGMQHSHGFSRASGGGVSLRRFLLGGQPAQPHHRQLPGHALNKVVPYNDDAFVSGRIAAASSTGLQQQQHQQQHHQQQSAHKNQPMAAHGHGHARSHVHAHPQAQEQSHAHGHSHVKSSVAQSLSLLQSTRGAYGLRHHAMEDLSSSVGFPYNVVAPRGMMQ
eukprot:jgi/Mesen1/5847/ME000298S05115